MVLRLLRPLPSVGRGVFFGDEGSHISSSPCSAGLSADLRSLDEREWARPRCSLNASVFVGDFSVLGIASSSIVFVRGREVLGERVRFRMAIP